MKGAVAVLREIYGLFVEDGAFALAILVWLGFIAAIARYVEAPVRGPLLFAGFAVPDRCRPARLGYALGLNRSS